MEFLKKLWNWALIKLNIRKKVEEIKTEVSEEVKNLVDEVETVNEKRKKLSDLISAEKIDLQPFETQDPKINQLKGYLLYLKDNAHKLGNKDILSKIEDLESRLTIDNYENLAEESEKLAMEMDKEMSDKKEIEKEKFKSEIKEKIELICDGNKPKDESVELIKDIPTQPLEVETVKDIKSKSRKKPTQKSDVKKEVSPKKQEPKKKETTDKVKPKRKPKPKSE